MKNSLITKRDELTTRIGQIESAFGAEYVPLKLRDELAEIAERANKSEVILAAFEAAGLVETNKISTDTTVYVHKAHNLVGVIPSEGRIEWNIQFHSDAIWVTCNSGSIFTIVGNDVALMDKNRDMVLEQLNKVSEATRDFRIAEFKCVYDCLYKAIMTKA